MKIRVNAARRQLSYFAGASAGVLSLLMAGAVITVAAPGSARAADECGVQAADGDMIICAAGTYATGISYTGVNVPVSIDDTAVVTDGGISLTGTGSVSLDAAVNSPDTGDLQITNTTGAAITLTGGAVNLDLTDGDFGDTAGFVTGLSGVVASGDGPITFNLGSTLLTGTDPAGYSLHAAATGSGGISLNGGMFNGDVLLTAVDGQVSSFVFSTSPGDLVTGDLTVATTGTGGINLLFFGRTSGSVDISTAGGTASTYLGNIGGDLTATIGGSGTANINAGSVAGSATLTTALGGGTLNTGAVGGGIVGTGAGVTIGAGGAVAGGIVATAAGGGANVRASSTVSGDITATATGGNAYVTAMDAVSGVVTASTGGGGMVSIDVQGSSDGITGMTTGGGAVNITARDVTGSGPGAPIAATSDFGNVLVNFNGLVTGGATKARINTGGSVTIALGNGVTASQSDFDITVGDALSIINNGTWLGAIDFTGATRGNFSNGSTWAADDITFTYGDDTFYNGGTVTFAGTRTYDFLGGAETFTNQAGSITIGTALTLNNLETFTNNSTLVIGTSAGASRLSLPDTTTLTNTRTIAFGGTATASDGETNDKLLADGAAYSASGVFSRLLIDADVSGGNQSNCVDGAFADCMSLVGGSTAGVTTIALNDIGAPTGGLNRIVLVDVEGGTSAADHFKLDAGFQADRGLFTYRLGYDADNQQHVLTGLPTRGVLEFGQIAASAQSIWHTGAGTWFERHADLRDGGEDTGGGVWLRVGRSLANRTQVLGFSALGEAFEFDGEYDQDTVAFVGGADLIRAGSDASKLVVGVTIGSIESEVGFKTSSGTTTFDGMSYGAYASWIGEGFFVDGLVQLNKLDLEQSGAWNPGGWGLGTADSTGAQVEAGLRWQVNDSEAYVEPLASFSYVTTKFDMLDFGGATLETDDAQSLRASLGLRLGGNLDFGAVRLKLNGTTRVWQEVEGEYSAGLSSMGAGFALADNLNGTFGEFGFGLGLYTGAISASFQTGVKFQENYLSSDTSLAIRYAW